ncbi:MAG: hypothetical protein WCF93_03655 [Candidatus Moraniibacteriota bacterium]
MDTGDIRKTTIPASNFLATLAKNVENSALTDAQFRQLVQNTLPIVIIDTPKKNEECIEITFSVEDLNRIFSQKMISIAIDNDNIETNLCKIIYVDEDIMHIELKTGKVFTLIPESISRNGISGRCLSENGYQINFTM